MRQDLASPRSACGPHTPMTPSSAVPLVPDDETAAKKGGQRTSVYARTVFFMSLWCVDTEC